MELRPLFINGLINKLSLGLKTFHDAKIHSWCELKGAMNTVWGYPIIIYQKSLPNLPSQWAFSTTPLDFLTISYREKKKPWSYIFFRRMTQWTQQKMSKTCRGVLCFLPFFTTKVVKDSPSWMLFLLLKNIVKNGCLIQELPGIDGYIVGVVSTKPWFTTRKGKYSILLLLIGRFTLNPLTFTNSTGCFPVFEVGPKIQGGPLPVISKIIAPLIGVIATVTQL